VIQCPVCRTRHVANTVYCAECGAYLLGKENLETDPIELAQIRWQGKADDVQFQDVDLPDTGPLTIRLLIGKDTRKRELEIALVRPIRLGRSDPTQNIFPEVDLTDDLAIEYGVSREHVRIYREGDVTLIEDLGSTNGTLLNGERLAPYMPEPLRHGDQLQLGTLLIEVGLY
jgi:hypothetical protein